MTAKIQAITDPKTLEAQAPAWRDLAANASEPNIFYEDWMLLPALRYLREGERIEIVLVFGGDGSLDGLFPLEFRSRYHGLPIANVKLWQHRHAYLCTPLIRRGRETESIDVFFHWLKTERSHFRLHTWNWVGGGGPIFSALQSLVEKERLKTRLESFDRATAVKVVDRDSHLATKISAKQRKNLIRLEKRLQEAGHYAYRITPTPPSAVDWANSFMELEKKGWKGDSATALANHRDDAAFFTECVEGAANWGKLLVFDALLDGAQIASKVDFISGGTAFCFKIAFDEKYAKLNPGVVLEFEHLRAMYDYPFQDVDYCAMPGTVMFERLTPDKRRIHSLSVALRAFPEGLVQTFITKIKAFRQSRAASADESSANAPESA